MFGFIKGIFILGLLGVLFVLGYGFYQDYQTKNSPYQNVFSRGVVPEELPDGFYRVEFSGFKGSWAGKQFDQFEESGMNIFREIGEDIERNPFNMVVDYGVADKELLVIRLDYTFSDNPWYYPFLKDEIVQIDEDEYLAKQHVVFPFWTFAHGFYTLKKSNRIIDPTLPKPRDNE